MKHTEYCQQIASALACGDALNEAQLNHLSQCECCQTEEAKFKQLDAMFEFCEQKASVDFTDQVMVKLDDGHAAKTLVERLIEISPLRIGLVFSASVVVVSHLVRFVFTTFVASTAVY